MSSNKVMCLLGLPQALQMSSALAYAAKALTIETAQVSLVSRKTSDVSSSAALITVEFVAHGTCGRSVQVEVKFREDEFLSDSPTVGSGNPTPPTPPPVRNPGPPQVEAPAGPKSPPTAREAAVLVSTAKREVKEYELEDWAVRKYLEAGFEKLHELGDDFTVGARTVVSVDGKKVTARIRTTQDTKS